MNRPPDPHEDRASYCAWLADLTKRALMALPDGELPIAFRVTDSGQERWRDPLTQTSEWAFGIVDIEVDSFGPSDAANAVGGCSRKTWRAYQKDGQATLGLLNECLLAR